MSDTFHHKIHTGGPLPNMCPECDIALAWADRDRLAAEVDRLKALVGDQAKAIEWSKGRIITLESLALRLESKLSKYREALGKMVDQFGFHRVHNGMVHDERQAILDAESALSQFPVEKERINCAHCADGQKKSVGDLCDCPCHRSGGSK